MAGRSAPVDPFRAIRFDELRSYEIRWRDRQRFLLSKGFMLRPRLRPGWSPSWLTTGKSAFRSEDGIALPVRPNLVDATRISDGKLVYIKRVETNDLESSLAVMLSSRSMRNDSRNHSVPILNHFVDDEDSSVSYIVMPFLVEPDACDFQKVGEVIDFVDQILEGLAFLHEKGVAHRDCNFDNIMMDASAMYPQGIHPVNTWSLPDGFTPVTELPRSQVGVTYYFVDYGISSYFPPGQQRKLVTGDYGRDMDVPELSRTVPYDPFAVDIFIIGNLFRLKFFQVYSNVDFLEPLIVRTTKRDPSLRPDAQELLRLWTAERKRISFIAKGWRLKKRDENAMASVFRDCFGMASASLSFAGHFWRR